MEEETEDPILGVMPYLRELLDFNPSTTFLINERRNLISTFRAKHLNIAEFTNTVKSTEEEIKKHFKGWGLDDFIPIKPNQRANKMIMLNKKEELETIFDAYLELAQEYEKLVERKREVIKVPVVANIEKKDKETFVEQVREEIEFFYKHMKKVKIPKTKMIAARNEFIEDMSKGDEAKKLILEEYMNGYENKTESGDESKIKKKTQV